MCLKYERRLDEGQIMSRGFRCLSVEEAPAP